MKINEIPQNSILLIPNGANIEIRQYLLTHQIHGIKLMSLNQFLDSFTVLRSSDVFLRFQALKRLKKIQNECTFFKKTCLYNAFIVECLTLIECLHRYEIPVDQLPQNNAKEQEMHKIIACLYDLPTTSFIHQQVLHSLTLHDCENVYLLLPHASYDEQIILRHLIHLGAKTIQFDSCNPQIEYHYAMNMRQEVESMAQSIILHQIQPFDCMIGIQDETYYPLIHSVFTRYHIPVNKKETKINEVVLQCITCLKLANENNLDTFNQCLMNHCFDISNALLTAQNIWPYEWHEAYPDLTEFKNELELYTPSQIQWLIQLINQANEDKNKIYPLLNQLTQAPSYLHKIAIVDEILRNKYAKQPENNKIILQLQRFFQEAAPYLEDETDFTLLLELLESMKFSNEDKQLNVFQVSRIVDIALTHKHLFILGATQNNYPGFKGHSGIFDENYIAKIPSFPSLQERFEAQTQSILNILSQANHLHITYPLNDYLGKSFESSLEIEEALQQEKADLVELIQLKGSEQEIDDISSIQASSLYLQDSLFKGSVSSLESYISCNYQYFLKNGCRIQEPFSVGFDVAKLGTLTHAIFEQLVNQYGKQYANVEWNQVLEIMEKGFNEMHQIFPHLDFTLMQVRLKERLKMNLSFMQAMEQHSQLIPTYTEKEFHHLIPLNSTINMDMKGYIDRIDCDNESFRIIDYKSSAHSLNKNNVFSGQQLQLCTYLIYMQEELQKRPLGAFYYSFHNEERKGPYEKVKRSGTYEIIPCDILAMNDQLFDSHLLSGWFFDEGYNRMDDIGAFTKGLGLNKQGVVDIKGTSRLKVYDLNEVKVKIEEMLRLIASQILEGKIKPNPNESSCTYCDYQRICRFKKSATEKKQLVDFPTCMQDKKKEETENE